jgi:hypothetical protein
VIETQIGAFERILHTGATSTSLLIILLQSRDEVCLVAGDDQAALLENLLQVGDLHLLVVRHGEWNVLASERISAGSDRWY